MDNKRFLLGKFWHPDHVLAAVKKFKEKNVLVYDVYSPFPLHGIEPFLNIRRSRLAIASFIYGLLGVTTAVSMMSLIYGAVWPMNIGGKPSLAFVDFVPISFELTVLFAAHGMVLTFFIVGQYWPGKKVKLFDDRQTDDVFIVAFDEDKIENEDEVRAMLVEEGAYEVTTQSLA